MKITAKYREIQNERKTKRAKRNGRNLKLRVLKNQTLSLTYGKPKKKYFLSGRATNRGKGLNGCATKEKRTFLMEGKKFLWPLSRGVRGAKGLSGRATKKEFFLRLTYSHTPTYH